jgi:uncharacterized protein
VIVIFWVILLVVVCVLVGMASLEERDELMDHYPEAQFIVRVREREVFPNCPRYI